MAQFATMTLCRMQPSKRKHWMCVQFPHSEELYGHVKAALAKAEVGTLVSLVVFTTPSSNHCPETTLHMTASVALHAAVLTMCHPCSTMQLMTGLITTIFIIATSLLKHRSSICLQPHVRQTDIAPLAGGLHAEYTGKELCGLASCSRRSHAIGS